MSARLNSLVTGAAWLVVAVGCVDHADNAPDTVGDGKADGLGAFTLELSPGGDGLAATDSPRLPGASPSSTTLTCPTQARTSDGWRLICERGEERLSVTYDPVERIGAGIYLMSVSSPDHRAYYHCAATAAETDEWPTELECTAKTPRTSIDGQLVSPFSPSLDGVGLINAHRVSTDASSGAQLVRGMQPFRDADYADLQQLGVTTVLIFKRANSVNEVEDETDALTSIGVPASQVTNIAFPWKDFSDFAEPCRMTVRSLKLLRESVAAGKTTFFHCTVGEDRTGYLAGLYRLLTETASVPTIFEQELCEHGYSSGNPQKPYAGVVRQLDADLTPVFLKMAFKIANGELTESALEEAVCDTDPADDPAFASDQWDAARFRCSISTRYRL